ncbi:MAG: ABC transporter permease [Anaerolineae bacterium]
MRNVWTIARHEFLINVRRPGFIIITLLIPAMGALGLLIAAFFGGQASQVLERTFVPEMNLIGVVDHSGLFTPMLLEFNDEFVSFADEEAGRAALEDEQIGTLLIFSEDYLDTGRVDILSLESSFTVSIIEDSSTLQNFVIHHLLRDSEDAALRARLLDPVNPVVVSLAPGQAGEETSSGMGDPASLILNSMVPYFLGILLVITIFSASGYLLQSVSNEKSSRVIEVVLSSVSARELLAGKVLGLGALGLAQVLFWLASAFVLSGGVVGLFGIGIALFAKPSVFVLSVVYYVLGFLIYAVLMGVGGAMGTTQQESQQIAGMFSFMAALPMMVIGFIFANPNALLARILSWFPLTAPTMMMMRLTLGNIPTVDVVLSIVLCLLTIPFILWGGAKIFRASLLMYGKRPGLREIWQMLRAA